jgi:hypothetical protein
MYPVYVELSDEGRVSKVIIDFELTIDLEMENQQSNQDVNLSVNGTSGDTIVTEFYNKLDILTELWTNYRDDDELKDFIEYNDLGLPMAYLLFYEMVSPNEKSELYINETFDSLLAFLGKEDKGFEDLSHLFNSVNK